jgi:hypothetical protein
MVSASQIRNELSFALAGILSLDDFEDWLIENTWSIHNTGSKAAEALTFAIEGAFSEYTSERISEKQLREELSKVVFSETATVEINDALPNLWSAEPIWSFRSSAFLMKVPVRL